MATYFKGNTYHVGQNLNENWTDLTKNQNFIKAVSSIAGGGSAGLGGTQYTYVAANGTPEENAAELQAAYDLAKTQVLSDVINIPILDPLNTLPSFNLNVGVGFYGVQFDIGFPLELPIPVVDGGTYNVIITGIETTITLESQGMGNYTFSTTLPVGTYTINSVDDFLFLQENTVRSTVIVSPGLFDFSSNFLVDTDGVNIVSLDGNRSIIFSGDGTIDVSANDCFIKGVDVVDKKFIIGDNLSTLTVENCKGGDYSFTGTESGLPFNPIVISGTFINCEGGYNSFGYIYDTVSGTFTNCKVITGFGYQCEASGIFDSCKAIEYGSFGTDGIASGTFTNCIGSNGGFGGNGTLTGKLYYCRLIANTFNTVSGGGITRLCLDGFNTENNQG